MNTDQLITHARSRFDHVAARRVLREKYQAKLTFAHKGGMFKAGPELLTLLHSCPVEDEVVIEDLYGNPIKIDPLELQHLTHSRWQEQMNAWLVEYEELNKNR